MRGTEQKKSLDPFHDALMEQLIGVLIVSPQNINLWVIQMFRRGFLVFYSNYFKLSMMVVMANFPGLMLLYVLILEYPEQNRIGLGKCAPEEAKILVNRMTRTEE